MRPRFLVFFSGFALMVIELMAGRVTAPYLGASLYTWTGIIAAVLLGIALGAWVGGRLGDAKPPALVLGCFLMLAGCSVALGYLIAPLVSAPMPFFALVVFFPPAFFLAAVQPLVVKTVLSELDQTGRTVGTLGAWNAAGSILGTYLAGFVFAYFLSTRLVWFAVAIALFIVGVIILTRKRV